MTATPVLVVEDDSDLRRLLSEGLSREGFIVATARTGNEAVTAADRAAPSLLVIDIGLPDADGRDVLQALRSRGVQAPALFLTAREALVDRLAGFSAGADDYLVKPFAFAELVARLRVLERRDRPSGPSYAGGLHLDPSSHAVTCHGRMIDLTPTEFRLLGALAASPGRTLRRRELVATAWPDGAIVHDNTLDVYIGRIRRKLATLTDEVAISTLHGVGYSLR
jgi:two-component system OmpR family response regulator